MKKLTQKPFKLGTYQLGFQWVDLWLDPSSNDGSFVWTSDRTENSRITVGIYNQNYGDALGTLIHEAMENICCDLGLRFKRTAMYADDSGAYWFNMNHVDFTEICSRLGPFIQLCQSDLMTAHHHYHPKK